MAAFPKTLRHYLTGNVSRGTLLGILLPLSFISLFSTLVIAAQRFPEAYDWRRQVISHLISPRYNADGYLISSLGMALSALLAVPFAGYVSQRLRLVSPRLSHGSGVALGVGILLVVTVTLPLNVASMPSNVRWVHEALARTAGLGIFGGMVGCCLCGWKDRFRRLGGQQLLNLQMVTAWTSLTLLPIVCGALAGVLKFARKAQLDWADQLRMNLKETMLWQLAFWEWVGVVAFVLFMLISVLLLPARLSPNEPRHRA